MINEKDKVFIDAVKNKVRYIEYSRQKEEEQFKKLDNEMRLKKRKFAKRFSVGLVISLAIICSLQLFDTGVILLLSIYMIASASYYENHFSTNKDKS